MKELQKIQRVPAFFKLRFPFRYLNYFLIQALIQLSAENYFPFLITPYLAPGRNSKLSRMK
jgi:hypothetical protein